MKKLFIFILILCAAGWIYYNKYKEPQKEEDKNVIVLSGNIEVTETDLGFKIAGRINKLFTDEGQKVSEGDKIASLENAEIGQNVEQSKAVLKEAAVRLDELKAGSRPQEIKQAKTSLNIAEVDLDNAKKDYDRTTALYKDGTLTKKEMDTAQKIYDSAELNKKNASEILSLVKEGPRAEEIKAAEAKVLQAKAALAAAEEKLKDTTIFAPVSGVILNKIYEKGEIIPAGVGVFTLGDLSDPWIKVYVKEDKLGLVKLGQKAEVTVDSYPGQIYHRVVSYISSEAEFTPKNVQTQEERIKLVFGIKVKVQNLNDELKPGMPADVKILINQ